MLRAAEGGRPGLTEAGGGESRETRRLLVPAEDGWVRLSFIYT